MSVPRGSLVVELDVRPPAHGDPDRQLAAALDVARAVGLDVQADAPKARVSGARAAVLASLPQMTAAAVAAGASKVSVLLVADGR